MADKKKKKQKAVLGVFEIIPNSMEDLDKMVEDVVKPTVEENGGAVETYKIQEIAFGAKKIIARIILREQEGGTTPLEDGLTNRDEIQRAECTMASLIS